MMQILFTVIGLTLAAGAGYALILNYSVQTISSEVADTSERLDMAAAAIRHMSHQIPGTSEISPPAPGASGDVPYSVMPAGSGPFTSTVDGKPFVYCPIGRLSTAEIAALGNTYSATFHDTADRAILVHGGLVVDTDLTLDSDLEATFKPIAILFAPDRGRTAAAPCSRISVRDGNPFDPYGSVRVISALGDLSNGNGIREEAKTIYVSSAGRGGGTSPTDRASINSALLYYAVNRPAQMTISLLDTAAVGSGAWTQFSAASAAMDSELVIVGESTNAAISVPGASNWQVPGKLSFRNVSLVGPRLIAGPGDSVTLTGPVSFFPTSNISAIRVEKGGAVVARNALIRAENSGQYLLEVSGLVDFRDTSLGSLSTNPRAHIFLNDGKVELSSSMIGDVGSGSQRPSAAPFYVYGGGSLVSGASSGALLSGTGQCYVSAGGDRIFKWSNHSRLQVPTEAYYTAPDIDDNQDDIEAYEAALNERSLARQYLRAAVSCS